MLSDVGNRVSEILLCLTLGGVGSSETDLSGITTIVLLSSFISSNSINKNQLAPVTIGENRI